MDRIHQSILLSFNYLIPLRRFFYLDELWIVTDHVLLFSVANRYGEDYCDQDSQKCGFPRVARDAFGESGYLRWSWGSRSAVTEPTPSGHDPFTR